MICSLVPAAYLQTMSLIAGTPAPPGDIRAVQPEIQLRPVRVSMLVPQHAYYIASYKEVFI